MSGIYFEIDSIAFLLAAGFALVFWIFLRWRKRFSSPSLSFSKVQDLKAAVRGWRAAYADLPRLLVFAALFLFIAAFIDPHLLIKREEKGAGAPEKALPTKGIAIYLLLDQSGSMTEKVLARTPSGSRTYITKIQLLKEVTRDFVAGNPELNLKGRPNDLIGLIFFARAPQIIVPLTLDHKTILDKLAKFDVIQNEDQDGTAIGYAIFKTANLIAATRYYAEAFAGKAKPAYEIKNSIIIVVTDGLQDPSPLDKGRRLRNMSLEEAAEYAKKEGVKVYIVNVEPDIASEKYAPDRHLMERITALTGGKFYLVDSTTSLGDIYSDIDKLEKSEIPPEEEEIKALSKDKQPNLYRRVSFYPYLIGLGMLCLLLSLLLQSTVLRKVP